MRQNFWSCAGVLLVLTVLLAGCNGGGSNQAAATPAGASSAPTSGSTNAATSPPATAAAVGTATAATKPTARPTVAATEVPTLASYNVTLGKLEGDYHYIGSEQAPVTLIHYADYACRDCADYVLNIEPQLVQNEVKAGRLKIVYHPLVRYGNISERAAEAAECASREGRFWEMRYGLFQRQTQLFTLIDLDPMLSALAVQTGLQAPPFAECMKERETLPESLAQSREAEEHGVEALPAFEINGQRLSGKVTLEQLRELIAQAGQK